MLIRADMDLNVTNSGAAVAVVGGRVRLRDSFFLSDLRDLVPGGNVASPRRRPPYFSVEEQPWAGWRLNLNVEGDRFLRIRSPLFRGVASTTLKLEGTLKEPMALGEARINSGMITFPFGSLNVQQGFVTLTSDNPYRPNLLVNAEAQRLGYDIRMEATGPADQPVVLFSSTPPLSSEQILMMLTTGQVPQGMAGTSTQRRAQGLALFLGKNLLTEFGIGDGGEGRLSVQSGEHLTEAGKPTYDVEYQLSDRWSLLGEYDRFGQYNLGLKWRVYSK
jgi:translocation and assembly module TamB